MKRPAVLLVVAAGALAAAAALAQNPPGAQTPPVASPRPAARADVAPTPHVPGELDCRSCHIGDHQAIVRMYVGTGGRGAPAMPSKMAQVHVECIACHTAPRTREGGVGLGAQAFGPSEQACLTCHGEKYRGMLGRWKSTLTRMTELVTPKVTAVRAALPPADRRDAKSGRAHRLVDDAEFNIKYVGLGKGIHNVFYAADLLKVANGWLDDAARLLGKPRAATDDQLVRGGYCAVLCHEAAGVKAKDTVTFAGRPVPHVRHVAELGATCTSCHSAETHTRVTATAATCSGCHHGPQNDKCEGCHTRQAAFYRGDTKTPLAKVAPNLMAAAVTCVNCHDFTEKNPRAAIAGKCVACHEPPYTALLTEWRTGYEGDFKRTADAIAKAQVAVAAARKAGRPAAEAEARLQEARDALALVRAARPAHNPLGADALLSAAERRAREATAPSP